MSTEDEISEIKPPEGRIDYSEYEIPRDLTAFKRDVLFVIASIDEPVGLRIAEAMEIMTRKPVNHGQLYPSLDELHDMGLIDKMPKDERTNEYRLTRRGKYVIEGYRDFIIDALPRE